MQILNSLQIKNGAKPIQRNNGLLTQPSQFVKKDEKTFEWAAETMDWNEAEGIKQIRRNGRRLLKNIRLAKGIIDKSDYIVSEYNEYSDVIQKLDYDEDSAMELRFYPLIPNVIRFMKAKFAERNPKLMFDVKDDLSRNEMLEEKRQMIEETILAQEQQKMIQKLISMGMDPESEEFQTELDPAKLKTLPQIEQFFKKDYRSMYAEWATHLKNIDEKRFNMKELEVQAFEESFTTDREFWHFKMNADDYEVQLWNPLFTSYKKSVGQKYMSGANNIENFQLLTVSDVIDEYGYLMDEDQLLSLEHTRPGASAMYNIVGTPNDGQMYDSGKSYKWNTTGPSLGMRQLQGMSEPWEKNGDIVQWLNTGSEDFLDFGNKDLVRVTTMYWKTQRRLGHLTKITEEGERIQSIVTEDYEITDKPMYNNVLRKEKDASTLIFGEHIEWIWGPEVWGGVKISPNLPAGSSNARGAWEPIYLGIDSKKPSRLKFQFKGDYTIYGCKLPVEGRVFSDDNTRSVPPIELMKPHQIGYNIVLNQMMDILVDELGNIAMIDQNSLPKHSMGEDWGPNNVAKSFEAMREYQLMLLDTSMKNTEGGANFNNWGTVLDMSQTKRLLGRVEYAKFFEHQALKVFGISEEAMGQIQASQSATGTQQSVSATVSQIEMYFIQHSDYLMPRVHQMRTDLAQYYNSNKPSLQLQYLNNAEERINFEMNSTNLLSRDIHAYCVSDANSRFILAEMKNFFMANNTTGASGYDIGSVLKAESVAEMDRILKASEEKMMAQRQAEMEHEQSLAQQAIEAAAAQDDKNKAFEAEQNRLKIIADLNREMIRAAGQEASDIQADGQDDYLQRLDFIQNNTQFLDKMNLDREKESNKNQLEREKLNVKREEIQAGLEKENKKLQVAITNKNYLDKKPVPPKKKK